MQKNQKKKVNLALRLRMWVLQMFSVSVPNFYRCIKLVWLENESVILEVLKPRFP